jgi:hypothetical protein
MAAHGEKQMAIYRVRASFDSYRIHVALITQHCPLGLADAIQGLIQGRGNRMLHLIGWGIGGVSKGNGQMLNDLERAFIAAEPAPNSETARVPGERSFPAVYQMNRGA